MDKQTVVDISRRAEAEQKAEKETWPIPGFEKTLGEFEAEIVIYGNVFNWQIQNKDELINTISAFLQQLDSEFNDECKVLQDEMEAGIYKENVNVVPYVAYERFHNLLLRLFPALNNPKPTKGEQ